MDKFFRGFGYALKGLVLAFRTQLNFRVQFFCALLVIAAGVVLRLTRWEWIAVSLCVGVVLAAETLNTSIEELTNMVSPEFHVQAGKIKDFSAAAVLIVCIAAVVVALVIFVPRIFFLLTLYR